MRDLATRITITLGGNIAGAARGFGQAFNQLANSSERDLTRMGRAVSLAGRGIDGLANRYTALLGGAAGLGTAKMLVEQERRFTRLGIAADLGADEVSKLKNEIFEAASLPEVRLDPTEVTSAVEQILEKTGNLELASKNLRNIGLAIQGSGAAGADVGSMFADMYEKFGLVKAEDIMASTDALVNQGKAGAFTLKDLATQGSRVMSAYAVSGRQGTDAVKEMGAMLQMIRRGVAGPEQAATAFEAVMRNLQDADKIKMLKAGGIQLMDPKQPGVMRSVIDIMQDVIKKTKGDNTKIGKVFDQEAMRAFSAAVIEYKRTGGFESFSNFMNVQSDGAAVVADSVRAANDAAGSIQTIVTAWKRVMDASLTGPIRTVADAINTIDPKNLERAMTALTYGAAAIGAIVLGVKAIQGFRAAKDAIGWVMNGDKKGAGGAGKPLPGAPGVMQVRVTNWPPSLYRGINNYGPGMDAGGGGRGRGAALRGRMGSLGSGLARGAMPLALAATAVEGAMVLAGDGSAGDKARAAAGLGGRVAGMAAGAKLGAMGGAMFGPAGIAVGGLLGGAAGAYLGEEIADAFSAKLSDWFSGKESKSEVVLRVEGQTAGMRVESMSGNGNVDVDIATGRLMGVP
ncbi:phage tail tape measure protein [Ferrovibrio sp.]|uniref:phage tail tape measure protein n=1 Tax=Ferrovibrio sp. TaxID=1917215 RepID=UPI0035B44E38